MAEEQQVTAIGNKVFIVHGRDEATKQTTARFLEKLGLEPVILHEQPNVGRTIIEKFEDYSSVAYAVVLLTPDDLGGLASEKPELSLRSRQNVVFELGYFIGKLGRKKVCALYQKDVELPSDFHGVLYVPLDEAGAWKFLLAKELKAVGLDIDLNKAV
jgi:predicted nucleotide-binding protein